MRWGVLSTAEISGKVAPGLACAPGSSLVAVASRSRERSEAWCKRLGVSVTVHDSYDALLADKNVDAVYIPLPSGLRNEWIVKAAQAGKHVYAEKPFAGSVEDLEIVLDECRKNKVQFMDGTMWLHSTRTKEMKQALEGGRIGKVRRVSAAFTFMNPGEEWLHGGNGRTDKTREPMGCLGDQGWYPVGAIMWAFDYELPERVQMTHVVKNRVDTIVEAGGVLHFSGQRTASFDAGCMLAHRSWVEVVGEQGLVRVDDLVGGAGRQGRFDAYSIPGFVGSATYTLGDKDGRDTEVSVTPCDHVISLVTDFQAAVDAGTVSDWPQRSLACHRAMHALFQSAQNNCKEISLTPPVAKN